MALIAETKPSIALKTADLEPHDAAAPGERWSLPG